MEGCWRMFTREVTTRGLTPGWRVMSGRQSRQTFTLALAPLGCGLLLGAEVDLSQPIFGMVITQILDPHVLF